MKKVESYVSGWMLLTFWGEDDSSASKHHKRAETLQSKNTGDRVHML